MSAAEARMEQSRVGWQAAAPPLSARVAPSELEDAYCVTGQSPSAGTVIAYPKQSTVVRLRVDARPTESAVSSCTGRDKKATRKLTSSRRRAGLSTS
jgi:hypothetical protein